MGHLEPGEAFKPDHFQTGDIFSMNGHVWICLGKCEDGSLVILHSTPSDSINGQGGGGVQINGVGDSENCQAVKLAEKYMSQYYPSGGSAITRSIRVLTATLSTAAKMPASSAGI